MDSQGFLISPKKAEILLLFHDHKVFPKLIKHIFPVEEQACLNKATATLCLQPLSSDRIKGRNAGEDERGLWRVPTLLVYFETHLRSDTTVVKAFRI